MNGEPLDLARLRALFGESLAGAGELVALALAEGADALEAIRGAAAAGDAPALGETAHALKGAAGNVGAVDVSAAAAALERAAQNGDLAACDRLVLELEAALGELDAALRALTGR